jgi:RNA polymerase sigma-70 factor (ECF subfamily)
MDLALMVDVAADRSDGEVLRWFDELRGPLRRYLIYWGATATDADDAVQESFLRLHRHLGKKGDRTNLYGWIFQVARNYLRDKRKSARRQRTVGVDGALAAVDPRSGPKKNVLDAEHDRLLHAAIEELPDQRMRLWASGLRYREIAEVLGFSTAGVGSLVQRAMCRLSQELFMSDLQHLPESESTRFLDNELTAEKTRHLEVCGECRAATAVTMQGDFDRQGKKR